MSDGSVWLNLPVGIGLQDVVRVLQHRFGFKNAKLLPTTSPEMQPDCAHIAPSGDREDGYFFCSPPSMEQDGFSVSFDDEELAEAVAQVTGGVIGGGVRSVGHFTGMISKGGGVAHQVRWAILNGHMQDPDDFPGFLHSVIAWRDTITRSGNAERNARMAEAALKAVGP